MPMPDANKAWALFMSDPVTFILIFSSVIAAIGVFVWWLRGHISKERIAALEERLRLAQDKYATVSGDITRLEATVARQDNMIAALSAVAATATRERVEELARSNTAIKSELSKLTTSTADLGTTLTIIGGHYGVSGSPVTFKVTKGSG
jgi:uncharacterized coiled-coil protein SlyX